MADQHRATAAVLFPKVWRCDGLQHVNLKHAGEAATGLSGSALRLIAVLAMFNRDAIHGGVQRVDRELIAQAVQDVLDHANHLADVVVGFDGHAEIERVSE